MQILAYLADRLRRYAYSLDTFTDDYDRDGDGDVKTVQQVNTVTRENQAKLSFPKRSQQSPTYLRQKRHLWDLLIQTLAPHDHDSGFQFNKSFQYDIIS
ncbi:unnamed protein product [Trichobilharzia regenti]|nr:unnamed protein product [Trichobilharzia regenti]